MPKGDAVIGSLNRLVEHVEDHLTEEIDIAALARGLGTTEYHLMDTRLIERPAFRLIGHARGLLDHRGARGRASAPPVVTGRAAAPPVVE